MQNKNFSIVDYYGEHRDYSCGYCKEEHCTSHAMWAYQMTVQDYQDLIDRGWRRSGQYCYKPHMSETCCPSYTIKCDVRNFKLNKSHKKILKRMNKFLRDGVHDKNAHGAESKTEEHKDSEDCGDIGELNRFLDKKSHSLTLNNDHEMNVNVNASMSIIKGNGQIKSNDKTSNLVHHQNGGGIDIVDAPATTAIVSSSTSSLMPPKKKAKLLRIERKKEKLASQGLEMEAKVSQNNEKTLTEYINDEPTTGVHKLKVKTVPSKVGASSESFNLFKKYQIHIHHDPEKKLSMQRYTKFLTDSPLKIKLVHVESDEFDETLSSSYKLYEKYQTIIHNDPPKKDTDYTNFLQISPLKLVRDESTPTNGFGSFHQQYWLDDTLIAVAVIDILPSCISSVYFFYDPDYGFLSLGTYGSLREVYFTQQLHLTNSAISNYYMGFYIHSCPKMRYKARLNPSYLLCPETYTWHHITEEMLNKLDESKYQRLHPDPNANEDNKMAENEIGSIVIIYRGECMTFQHFVSVMGQGLVKAVKEYVKLVGGTVANSMVLSIPRN